MQARISNDALVFLNERYTQFHLVTVQNLINIYFCYTKNTKYADKTIFFKDYRHCREANSNVYSLIIELLGECIELLAKNQLLKGAINLATFLINLALDRQDKNEETKTIMKKTFIVLAKNLNDQEYHSFTKQNVLFKVKLPNPCATLIWESICDSFSALNRLSSTLDKMHKQIYENHLAGLYYVEKESFIGFNPRTTPQQMPLKFFYCPDGETLDRVENRINERRFLHSHTPST